MKTMITKEKKNIFNCLNVLNNSSLTSIQGAAKYISAAYQIDEAIADAYLAEWKRNFNADGYDHLTVVEEPRCEEDENGRATNSSSKVCVGLNDSAWRIHVAAKGKGFWDEEKEIGTLLMLCVSELAEALEAHRSDSIANITMYERERDANGSPDDNVGINPELFEKFVKDTFEDEIADTIIRLLDLCGHYKIDIEKHINYKLQYNKTRARKHGKEY